ncbi:MAG: TonB-dependent receptor [Gemmatimonadetes bacterium]|nr:TonB-dependent receptor [Gemmatimonadota bacterium]MYC92342.1 TonB-dependent receptor [Gemmatimonadota bacterium]MYG36035.1 TonB-dependent receptor [Gemmatimonadota bacterium]
MKTEFVMAMVAAATVVLAAPVRLLDAQVVATVQVTVRATGAARDRPALDAGIRGAATPVRGATVVARGAGLAEVTDAHGVAVLRGIPPGRHALVISALGFREARIEVEAVNGRVARASVVLDPAPVTIAGLDVRVASREGITGATVLDPANLPPGVADLAAALDRVPGATVVRQGGPGAPATVQLRGSGGDQVLVLLDGAAINSPLTGVADLSTVDLASIARIVVIPGAQSARYGPRALGGVVLLESRDARTASGAVTAGAGSWSSVETSVSGARAFPSVSLSGGARWRRSDGAFTYDVPDFRGGGEAARENAAFSHAGGDVRIAGRGAANRSLRVHLSDMERGSPGGIGQPSLSGRQHHRRWGVSARVESTESAKRESAGLGGSARADVQWQRAEYGDPSPPFGRAYETLTRVRRAELALEGWWRSGDRLRVGLHATRLDVDSNILASRAVTLDEFGAWARAGHGWEPGHGVHLDLAAAIRADRHDLVDGVTASPAIDATLTRAGLTLELRWGRGFSPPGLGDLFFQEGVLVEPNPDLRPERIRGELTATLAHGWSLGAVSGEVRATAYRADIDDMILWFPDHRFVWSPDNHNVARRGLEVGATADLDGFGRTHTVTANAAWAEVEYTGAALDGQVAYRPRFTADLSLGLGLPAGITLSPSATHVGERRTAPGTPLNALGAYTLLDAGIAIPLTLGKRTGRLDLAVTNLLDERAALLADYPLPGRGWSTRIRIGAGR